MSEKRTQRTQHDQPSDEPQIVTNHDGSLVIYRTGPVITQAQMQRALKLNAEQASKQTAKQ